MRYLAIVLGLALAATGVVYTAETTTFTDAQRSFWSLQPVKKPPVPTVRNAAKARNPIDAFLLQKLEEKKWTFSAEADKRTLQCAA